MSKFCLLFLLALPLMAQPDSFRGDLNDRLQEMVAKDLFSGGVLIGKNDRIIFMRALGDAEKDYGAKTRIQTKYNIGSIGKTFTAVAIMQLVEKGKLAVKDPVAKYLPDFPHGNGIQIHHLLSHTSGLANYMAHSDYNARKARLRQVSDFLPLIFDQPLAIDTPGTFRYSNSGFVLLGAIVENVSGKRYDEYLRTNILIPAKMNNTGLIYREEVVADRATGYLISPTGQVTSNIFLEPPAGPDGGLYTTIQDMHAYRQALLNHKLLKAETLALMQKPRVQTSETDHYGYGWIIRKDGDQTWIGHGGGASGVSANFWMQPEDGFTVIILSNYNGGATFERQVFDLLYGRETAPIEEPLAKVVYEIARKHGLKDGLGNISQHLAKQNRELSSPNILNSLGYALLGERRNDWAIAVFQANVRIFPDYANGWDSLAEGYMVDGQTKLAIENYEKALKMNPENYNAANILKRLRAR